MTRRPLSILIVLFVIAFIGFAFYFLSQPFLADGDSYYHLGIAREFARHGIVHDFPWARFSVMRDGFGDKELLFHVVIAPWMWLGDAEEMGRLALALFNAILVTLLGWLGIRAVGSWGVLLPALVYFGSLPFADRAARLRPELLGLTLLLAVIWLAGRRRFILLFFASAAFALSYTAWHVVAFLAVVFALGDYFVESRLEWKTPAAVLGGIAGGLLIHPHFPHNLVIWWYQNALYFLYKDKVDIGTEIFPPVLRDTLLYHVPLVAALVIYALSTRHENDDEYERPARYLLIAAVLFALLFARMERMVTYLAPLAALAMVFRRRMIVRPRALAIGLALCLAAGLAQTAYVFQQDVGEVHFAEANWNAVGRIIPPGAKVAADWRDGTRLVFAAPQGRYLDVLDPVFMAAKYPREYAIAESIWSGAAIDVPSSLRALDSDYLFFFAVPQRARLLQRIVRDPRFTPLYSNGTILVRVGASPGFLRNWQLSNGAQYVWPDAVSAYVDLSSSIERCATARALMTAGAYQLEVAPSGTAEVRLDTALLAQRTKEGEAVIGSGLKIPLVVPQGEHWLAVTTCRSKKGMGFFALKR